MMRRALLLLLVFVGLLTFLAGGGSAKAISGADWRAGRIIDDNIFTSKDDMSPAQIQDFLNRMVGTGGNGRIAGQCDTNGVGTSELGGGTRAQYGSAHSNPAPFTCLKDYYEVPKTAPGPGIPASNYGGAAIPAGAKSAAQLIWDAAQQYNISPKVLLVMIQKESAGPLITDDWPFNSQYTYAMGAHCPDTSGCDANYAGFSIQISESAGLLRYYLDNMNQPWWPYKKLGNNTILYNPSSSCGSSNVNIESMATAALYTYTPYQPNPAALSVISDTSPGGSVPCGAYGNRNFWWYFTKWFGNPISPCAGTVNLGGLSGSKIIPYRYSQSSVSNLAYTQMNNTGSTCAEVHVDSSALNNWIAHIATGMRATDPTGGTFVSSKSRVDSKESLNYINYIGGGRVEVHRFSPNLLKFPGYYDVATNLSNVTPTSGMFVAGDFFGLGYDQLAYIIYSNGTGNVELHLFDPTMTKAVGYYDLTTNIGGVNATTGTFVAGDFLGRGYAQLAYVTYGNTEVHLLDIRNGRASRIYEVPTNLAGVSGTTGTFVAGDFLGRGYDQLEYVAYNGTATNMVEVHTFSQDLRRATGFQDIATNLPAFDPTK